jgi:hypothetical protein
MRPATRSIWPSSPCRPGGSLPLAADLNEGGNGLELSGVGRICFSLGGHQKQRKPGMLIVLPALNEKRPPGEDPVGVVMVTDNWEEECCQSIGARWEEECADPNSYYEDHLRRLPVNRAGAPSPVFMIQ